jgi:hypothetical protein
MFLPLLLRIVWVKTKLKWHYNLNNLITSISLFSRIMSSFSLRRVAQHPSEIITNSMPEVFHFHESVALFANSTFKRTRQLLISFLVLSASPGIIKKPRKKLNKYCTNHSNPFWKTVFFYNKKRFRWFMQVSLILSINNLHATPHMVWWMMMNGRPVFIPGGGEICNSRHPGILGASFFFWNFHQLINELIEIKSKSHYKNTGI